MNNRSIYRGATISPEQNKLSLINRLDLALGRMAFHLTEIVPLAKAEISDQNKSIGDGRFLRRTAAVAGLTIAAIYYNFDDIGEVFSNFASSQEPSPEQVETYLDSTRGGNRVMTDAAGNELTGNYYPEINQGD